MMQGGMLDDDVIDGEFTEVDDESQAEDEDGTPLHDEEGKPISKKKKKEAEDEAGPDPSLDDDKDPSLDDDDEDDEDEEERRERKKKKKKKKKKDEKKKRDGMAVLGAVAKFALLGAGVALLAIGAGPLGMVIGRGLVDLWSNIESTAANGGPEKTQEEIDHDTVDEILTQTASYMKNMDLTDLHQSSQHLFKAIAATGSPDIYNECFSACLPLTQGRPMGRPGKNFFGTANVTVDVMAAAIERRLSALHVLRDVSRDTDGDDECYMFFCNDKQRTLVALGMTNTHGLYHVAFLNW
ncbi:hypothetical protein D3C71_1031570 [compost metagenome]